MDREKRIYYTNATGIEVTGIDIKLNIDYKSKDETINLCDIVFSPEQAKLTSIMLNKAIEEYEKRNRRLNIDVKAINKSEGENENGGEGK